ncbi:hypothetical protein [Rhodococcus sp. BH5]|uniref:hypothetical protein n=1 Tax=Rhodococcus sp. BH5 TaxID=2871702 RepID=UPI0022CD5385|nr:hypothetical protein [Rhodococcus sp. BH5]MCZ9635037.1 hypothetical protein [Rhodococcus sp. BH5]
MNSGSGIDPAVKKPLVLSVVIVVVGLAVLGSGPLRSGKVPVTALVVLVAAAVVIGAGYAVWRLLDQRSHAQREFDTYAEHLPGRRMLTGITTADAKTKAFALLRVTENDEKIPLERVFSGDTEKGRADVTEN